MGNYVYIYIYMVWDLRFGAKLLKGGYIGNNTGDYYKGFFWGKLGV